MAAGPHSSCQVLAGAGRSLLEPPLGLDQVTPKGPSSSASGVGIAMETSWSPSGDRTGKSPGASHMDLDPGSPQSLPVFFLSKACVEPGPNPAGCLEGPRCTAHSPTAPLILDADATEISRASEPRPTQSTILYPETR